MTLDDLPDLRPALARVLAAPAPPAGLPGLGAPAASPLGFAPDRAIRERAVTAVAGLLGTDNPAGAAALSQSDVFGALDEAMTAQDLSVNDLSDVFGAYLTHLWELSNGVVRDASPARLGAVARQARAVLLDAVPQNRRSPGDLQVLSDALAVQVFVYGVTAFRLTQDWKDRTRAVAENYRDLGRSLLGLNLDLFTLDDNGLVARSEQGFQT